MDNIKIIEEIKLDEELWVNIAKDHAGPLLQICSINGDCVTISLEETGILLNALPDLVKRLKSV